MFPKTEPKELLNGLQVIVSDGDFIGGYEELNKVEISSFYYSEETAGHVDRFRWGKFFACDEIS